METCRASFSEMGNGSSILKHLQIFVAYPMLVEAMAFVMKKKLLLLLQEFQALAAKAFVMDVLQGFMP